MKEIKKGVTVIDADTLLVKDDMIQWTGDNLKEVIDFTGKSPRFDEWFKSWDEYENYVHSHNDILKLFCEDGSHYEVPAGAWIVKTPDGYNVPSVAKYIQQEQPECSGNLVDVDAVREDFMREVYRVLDADPTNDRANAIINAFDSLPTVSQEQPEGGCSEKPNDLLSELEADLEKVDWDVYESLNDVRRDMVELGRVLNARKED